MLQPPPQRVRPNNLLSGPRNLPVPQPSNPVTQQVHDWAGENKGNNNSIQDRQFSSVYFAVVISMRLCSNLALGQVKEILFISVNITIICKFASRVLNSVQHMTPSILRPSVQIIKKFPNTPLSGEIIEETSGRTDRHTRCVCVCVK